MRRNILIAISVTALAVLIPCSSVRAEEAPKPSLFVAPFIVTQRILEVEPEIGKSTVSLIRGILGRSYRFPSGVSLAEASKATGTTPRDLESDLTVCGDFGRAARAKWIIRGRMHSFGERVVIHLDLVEVPPEGPGRLKAIAMQQVDDLERIPGMLPELLRGLGLGEQPAEPAAEAPARPDPKPAVARARPELVEAKPTGARASGVKVANWIQCLGDADAGLRFSAAVELGRSGSEKAVDPLLTMAIEDQDIFVRRAAVRSLGELGEQRVVPALIDLLGDPEFFVAVTANQAILNLTRHDCGLKDGLSREDIEQVREAARAWWHSQE